MFNFVFMLNKVIEDEKEYDLDLRMLLAEHSGHTLPTGTVIESIDNLMDKLKKLRKEQY